MKKQKRLRPWLLLAAALAFSALALGFRASPAREEEPAPYLVEEESFFSDFEILEAPYREKDEDGEEYVRFLCFLCVENPGSGTLPVTITGDFSEDFDGGLVTERELTAFFLTRDAQPPDSRSLLKVDRMSTQKTAELFLLEPGENRFWAVFTGPHGESSVKQDRRLPSIRIETVKGFGCDAKIGGETRWLESETAAELYGICRDAMAQGELIAHPAIPAFDAWPPLELDFRVMLSADAPERPGAYDYYRAYWYGTFHVFYDGEDDIVYFSPNPVVSSAYWYRVPAGTYDALRELLTGD